MNTSLKMIVVLTTIAILSGVVLSTWDGYTKPMIEYHKLQALKAAIKEVLPPHDSYEEITKNGITFYVGKSNESEDPVGIALNAVGNGFQGEVSMMVGLTADFSRITGLTVLAQVETPGLGTKIVEDPSNKSDPFWFPNQFRDLSVAPQIVVLKNQQPQKENEIQAITGATISSQAVAGILNNTIQIAKSTFNQ